MIAIGGVEEMLEQPGCPNLYWALTNLPHPFVALDKGLEGERVLIWAEFRDLKSDTAMTPEELRKVIAHVDKIRDLDMVKSKKARVYLNERNTNEKYLQSARERLVEVGLSEEAIKSFPADQILLLDERRAYEVHRDDLMKFMKLPSWQVEERLAKINVTKDEGLFGFLTPALMKVRRAQSRLEQRIAMLRHIEALRMYAAANEGKLPPTLKDCGVPLSDDPFTGKPFRYEVKGTTAHLYGSPPRGEEKVPAFNVHYEITIRK
jgi:hypothetical protein